MTEDAARPNFLIFVVDQMQSFSLGCHGNPDVRTPNLDRLAQSGVSFTRAYCNNPACAPSRATILTGLTPRQHGCITCGNILPEHVPTVTQALANAGLSTDDLEAGSYDIYISVEKGGYPSITDSSSVTVQQRPIRQPDNDSSGQTGIPGFPVASIAIGLVLATVIVTALNRVHAN